MKKCPYCNSELADEVRFCVYCMHSLDNKKTVENKRRDYLPLKIAAVVLTVAFAALSIFFILRGVLHTNAAAPYDGETSEYNAPYETTDEQSASEISGGETEADISEKDQTAETPSLSETTSYPPVFPFETEKDTLPVNNDRTGKNTAYHETDTVSYDTGYETKPNDSAPPDTQTDDTGSIDSTSETKAPETDEPETTAETEPVTTQHIHTDSCKKWVVDKPYKAAVYENQKVVDIPYSPAEYGDVPKEVTDCHYRIVFYEHDSNYYPVQLDDITFVSTAKFYEWLDENNGGFYFPNLAFVNDDGYVTVTWGGYDGIVVQFSYYMYDEYTTVVYEYGLVKEEQPEVSHIEKVLVSPEQKEEGHYEYICGY